MYQKLFEEYKLNEELTLQNRITMAPVTRCFADEELVPTKEMATYYAKRGDAGLIISEATVISKLAQGYPNQPGIYTKEQIDGWKNINDKVHEKGAKIFCQIFHAGRISHKIHHGQQPIAPSAVTFEGRMPRSELMYEEPRALNTNEIKNIIDEFVQAAVNSIEAGFDGIEIHAANGYLLDQFLHQDTNRRLDAYGGSPENRSKILLEIIDEISKAIGKERVGIRLSPYAYLHMEYTDGDEKTFDYLLREIEKREIAYVHTGTFDDRENVAYLNGKVSEYMRNNYQGVVMGNGSYTPEEGDALVENGSFDLFALGRPFIANPDLVLKLKNDEPLVTYEESMLDTLV